MLSKNILIMVVMMSVKETPANFHMTDSKTITVTIVKSKIPSWLIPVVIGGAAIAATGIFIKKKKGG